MNSNRPGRRTPDDHGRGPVFECPRVALRAVLAGCLTVGSLFAAEPPARDLSAQRELERTLYEGMFNPDFEGEVRFISAVPLISRTPEVRPASQYYTALLMQAEYSIESLFYARVRQLFTEAVGADPEVPAMRKGLRLEAAGRVLLAVFGEREWLSAFRLAADDEEHAESHRQVPDGEAADHVHAEGAPGHEHALPELSAPVSAAKDPCRSMIPLPAGFQASHTETTTGLHCLQRVDQELWKEGRPELSRVLPMDAVQWRVYDHEPAPPHQCERFIARGIPFVAHRGESDYLICGWAKLGERVYLMGYDLAAIERRVSLSNSGASVTYSEYVRLAEEKRGQGKDPMVELDPLFWDYKSYFSVKNLGSFRVLAADGPEVVTALYPTGLNEERVRAIIAAELGTAKQQQAEWVRRKQGETQVNVERWLKKAREQQAAAEKEADQ